MARAHLALLIITLLLLFLGLAAVLTGIIGHVWYVNKDASRVIGLTKTCVLNERGVMVCTNRDVFTFSSKDYTFQLDLTLTGLTAASLFALLGIILATFMFCCQRTENSWRCCALLTSVVTSFAGGFSIAAVAYNEYWGKALYDNDFVHGWSVLIAWAGSGELLLATVMAYILMCISPTHGNLINGQAIYAADNVGYEMK